MGAKKGNKNNYKHGGISTKLYKVWSSMKNRCLNINHQAFNNYGGRGITISQGISAISMSKKLNP